MNREFEKTDGFSSLEEAMSFLDGTVNYEKKSHWNYSPRKLDLSRMQRLMAMLDNPHESFRSIHVAGTKGKGSTCAILSSCLSHAGFRTGLFTSPHLLTPLERIRVDGCNIPAADFCDLLADLKAHVERERSRPNGAPPTYFEILTALAFAYFRRAQVDWAVVEVGLGGRLDSTNVLRPECCAVTPIGFDHMDKLGTDIRSIAGEKAGIFKPDTPAVLGTQTYDDALDMLREKARSVGCPAIAAWETVEIDDLEPTGLRDGCGPGWRLTALAGDTRCPNLFLPLPGRHQVDNLTTALAVLQTLHERNLFRLDEPVLRDALAATRCPGRVEVLWRHPTVILDTAHTVESVRSLAGALRTHCPDSSPWFLFGCSGDKNVSGMMGILAERCRGLTATAADYPRAMPPEDIARAARQAGIGHVRVATPPARALRTLQAESSPDDLVCVTGSFYVAGEVRSLWVGEGGR